jgi:ribosomal protein L22
MTPDKDPKDQVEETEEKPAKAKAKAKAKPKAKAKGKAKAASKKAPAKAEAQATTPAEVEAEASAEAAESLPKPKKPAAKRGGGKAAGKSAPAKTPRGTASRRRGSGRSLAEPAVLVRAEAKYVRTSARKARLVCDHIRGKDVAQARAILAFTPRSAAKAWSKLLESAVANAEHNHELVGEDLRIHSVVADEGPTLKRFRPRAMGRATRIRKRTSHLKITLTPKES